MKKRKNYYQVHLKKKPKKVKRYTRKRKYNASELIDLLQSGFKRLNRVFKKGSIAAKKLNIALGVCGKCFGSGLMLTQDPGCAPEKDICDCMQQQPEIIMRKDGSTLKLGKNYTGRGKVGKVTGQHGHLFPALNPNLENEVLQYKQKIENKNEANKI